MATRYRVTFNRMSDGWPLLASYDQFTSLQYSANANDVTEAVLTLLPGDKLPTAAEMRGVSMSIWRAVDEFSGYELEMGTDWVVGRITTTINANGTVMQIAAQHPNVVLRRRIVGYRANTIQADKVERTAPDPSNWDYPIALISDYFRENVSQPIIDLIEPDAPPGFSTTLSVLYQGTTRNTRIHLSDGSLLYLNDDPSNIPTYEELHATPAGGERTAPAYVAPIDGEVLIRAFITEEAGGWGKTGWPEANWLFRTWAKTSSLNGGTTTLTYRVYSRAAGGTETPLFSISGTIDSTEYKHYDIFGVQSAFAMIATDRLVVKLYASATAGVQSDTRRLLVAGVQEGPDFGVVTEVTSGYQNLLNVLQDLAQERDSSGNRAYFELVTHQGATTFRTRKNYLGADQTARVRFGIDLGNVEELTITKDYDKEVNVLYAGGEGSADQQLVVRVRRDAGIANGFYWCEEFETFGDVEVAQVLEAMARRELDTKRAKRILRAKVLNVGPFLYGRDYRHGDLVSLMTDEAMYTCHIYAVTVTVDENGENVEVFLDAQTDAD